MKQRTNVIRELRTKRLVLRPLKMSDAESIAKNISDLDVSKWLLVVPYPYTLNDAKNWVKHNQEKWRKRPPNDYTFGIELKSEGRIIGGMGLHHIDSYSGYADVGYWLGSRYHRQGYGSEALNAVINLAFGRLKLRRLEAGVFRGNPSSGKLLEKFGFVREGLKVKARRCKADGQIKDEYIYGLLREDYKLKRR